MFEESLVESTHRIQGQSRSSFALSIGIQAAIAAAVIMVPLLHPEAVRHLVLASPQLFAPTPPPIPPPPVRVRAQVSEATNAPAAAAPAQLVRSTFHSAVDSLLRPSPGEDTTAPLANNLPSGMGAPNSLGTDLFSKAPTGPAIAVAGPARPTRISSGVSAGLLLAPIRPAYPHIAQVSRTEGTVIIHAIISKKGTIESAAVTSGPAMLQSAALEAVRSARYRPYLLNGEPTEVDTTIQIVFRLSES